MLAEGQIIVGRHLRLQHGPLLGGNAPVPTAAWPNGQAVPLAFPLPPPAEGAVTDAKGAGDLSCGEPGVLGAQQSFTEIDRILLGHTPYYRKWSRPSQPALGSAVAVAIFMVTAVAMSFLIHWLTRGAL